MKKIKMGLLALVAISGIGSSFAFNHRARVVGETYYGYQDASGNFRWEISPSGHCKTLTGAFACTITSTTQQSIVTSTKNAFPANYRIVGGEGKVRM